MINIADLLVDYSTYNENCHPYKHIYAIKYFSGDRGCVAAVGAVSLAYIKPSIANYINYKFNEIGVDVQNMQRISINLFDGRCDAIKSHDINNIIITDGSIELGYDFPLNLIN